jgi:hypothetical protein
MEAVKLLTQEGEETRLGALTVLGTLCKQDPTLAEATALIVQTAQSQWTCEGSSTPALEQAARELLRRLKEPVADEPAPPRRSAIP